MKKQVAVALGWQSQHLQLPPASTRQRWQQQLMLAQQPGLMQELQLL